MIRNYHRYVRIVSPSKIAQFGTHIASWSRFSRWREVRLSKSLLKLRQDFAGSFVRSFETRSWTKSSKVAALRILFQRRRFTRREIHYASEFPTDEATSFVTFFLIVFRIFHFVSSFRFICDRRRNFDVYHIEESTI